MKRLLLSADDFALSRTVSDAILRLLEAGRITATGVMSDAPLWPALARELAPFAGRADLGLHLNLTHPFRPGDGARPLAYWLLAGHARLLRRGALRAAILERIDRFADRLGRLPDFLDGHLHVHALPVVRDALLSAIGLRYPADRPPYLRAPERMRIRGDGGAKRLFLTLLYAGLARRAAARGVPAGRWSGGLYSLSASSDFPGLMAGWLAEAADGGMLVCHPGLAPGDPGDPIRAARVAEYGYLAGPRFAADLKRFDIELIRRGPG